MGILLLLYIFAYYRFMQYIVPWKFSFYRKDRWIYRVCRSSYMPTDIFTDVTVYKENKYVFHCYYTDYKNERKKLVIPKCYPDIEEILYHDSNGSEHNRSSNY